MDPTDDAPTSPEWFRRRYWDYLERLRGSDRHSAAFENSYFGLVNDPFLNASIYTIGQFPMIAINRGAIVNLGFFFDMALSHPETFPHIGDPKAQTKWFEHMGNCDWNASLGEVLGHLALGAKPVAAQGERLHHARHLQMFALDFLFFHEAAHWHNGHDRFVSELTKQIYPRLDELSSPPQLGPIINQLMEVHADGSAVLMMTSEWLKGLNGPNPVFSSRLTALSTCATAIVFLFVLFGQERRQRITSIGVHPHPAMLVDKHPHPYIRLRTAQENSMHLASLIGDEAVKLMATAWQIAMEVVRHTCHRLAIPSSLWDIDPELGERTFQAMAMNWSPLQKQLDGCSRLRFD